MADDDYQTSVTHWFNELKAGNREAAHHLWDAYFDSLVRVARKRLGDKPRRVADEEDIAASVFRCLCEGAEKGRFTENMDRTDLWKLLVVITRQKVVDQMRRATTAKRGGGETRGESVFIGAGDDFSPRGIEQITAEEPTPQLLAELEEQRLQLLALLRDETLEQIALLRLSGCSNEEIAAETQLSLRSVERKLQLIRERWAGAATIE